jgi:RNA polymerase sigma-70 factor (ECF subfamily)
MVMGDDRREDSEIIQRILEGETHLFATLVSRYERLMYSFLLSQVKSFQEVQDISQEAFLKAYRHLSAFDPTRKFSAWVLKIAKNLLIDRYRKTTDSLGTNATTVQDLMSRKSVQSPEEIPGKRMETQEEFRQAFINILHLSEELRIPLLLRIVQELSYEEIADILDLPVQTVKNRIFKARQILRAKRDAEHEL